MHNTFQVEGKLKKNIKKAFLNWCFKWADHKSSANKDRLYTSLASPQRSWERMRLTKPSCSARCAAALHAIALVPTSTLCTRLQSIFLSSALPVTPPEHRLKKPKCLPYQHIMHTAPIHLLVICTSCYTTWTQIQEVLVPAIPAHCAHCSSPSSCQQHFLLHHLNTD